MAMNRGSVMIQASFLTWYFTLNRSGARSVWKEINSTYVFFFHIWKKDSGQSVPVSECAVGTEVHCGVAKMIYFSSPLFSLE